MDWTAAIEKNREALKRVLAQLVALAAMGIGGPLAFIPRQGEDTSRPAQAERGKESPALTLPRHLYRTLLDLLRPAEAAVRRLIIVAARGLEVAVSPPRPCKPKPALPRNLGIALVMSGADPVRAAAAKTARRYSLPLVDPLRQPRSNGRVYRGPLPVYAAPRILFPGVTEPSFLPPPPSPYDSVDAARLGLRLATLAAALDDLPGQARRFARWRARRDAAVAQSRQAGGAGRLPRLWPLRPGRPPGCRPKSAENVHVILDAVHGLAHWALESPDTS